MNQYTYLENFYGNSNELLLNEFDLSSITDNIKQSISKLNMSVVSKLSLQYEKKLINKLNEYDVDANKIKKIARQSSKNLYKDIKNGYDNKKSISITAKKLDKKIISSVYDTVKESTFSGIKIIFYLILSVALTLFLLTLLTAILVLSFGLNVYVAYFFVLMFSIELFALSVRMVFSLFNNDDENVSDLSDSQYSLDANTALNSISLNKLNDDKSFPVYATKVLTESFKNILQKVKK